MPPHCYFMMGDNRDNSLDSRFDPQLVEGDPKLGGCGLNNGLPSNPGNAGVGFVPEENLVGKAQIILLSWNTGPNENEPGGASIFKPWTWVTRRAAEPVLPGAALTARRDDTARRRGRRAGTSPRP